MSIEKRKLTDDEYSDKYDDKQYDSKKIKLTIEELESDENFRLTINPINPKYKILWDLYKKQKACYWVEEEIPYDKDKDDFETLNNDEKHFIKYILAFFAASDGIVNFNLRERFLREIKVVEAQLCYGFQLDMENTHGIVYSKLLENIVDDKTEYTYLLNAIQNIPSIKKMSDWALKWTNGNFPLGQRIIGYAIVEGIFFSGAFASIFWLKKGKQELFMPGLVKANEFIARDEGMHTNFACLLYRFISNRIDEQDVYNMIKESVEINQEFICEAISCKMIGMDQQSMATYIKYVADRLLMYLNYKKIFNVENPFPFMETIGLSIRNNMFENRTTDYQKSHTVNNNANWEFKKDDDF